MASASTTPTAVLEFGSWSVKGQPFTIEYSPRVLEEIRAENEILSGSVKEVRGSHQRVPVHDHRDWHLFGDSPGALPEFHRQRQRELRRLPEMAREVTPDDARRGAGIHQHADRAPLPAATDNELFVDEPHAQIASMALCDWGLSDSHIPNLVAIRLLR